ncbi:hypothetical protein HPP92_028214 [Vanilla planifolia]|uniref:Uncharacterized protein n=1 Tax=Vanilla planifolia TaxID=51239 RepID=A0A835P898_VANPL|nr:hypothetical protein HPP92_028214 [Vanilla planifolia]
MPTVSQKLRYSSAEAKLEVESRDKIESHLKKAKQIDSSKGTKEFYHHNNMARKFDGNQERQKSAFLRVPREISAYRSVHFLLLTFHEQLHLHFCKQLFSMSSPQYTIPALIETPPASSVTVALRALPNEPVEFKWAIRKPQCRSTVALERRTVSGEHRRPETECAPPESSSIGLQSSISIDERFLL